jgi:hypothetical protein
MVRHTVLKIFFLDFIHCLGVLKDLRKLDQGAQEIRILSSFHLKTESEPASETLWFKNSQTMVKVQKKTI